MRKWMLPYTLDTRIGLGMVGKRILSRILIPRHMRAPLQMLMPIGTESTKKLSRPGRQRRQSRAPRNGRCLQEGLKLLPTARARTGHGVVARLHYRSRTHALDATSLGHRHIRNAPWPMVTLAQRQMPQASLAKAPVRRRTSAVA